ncbi:hypothetical protein SAMN05518801_10780 [Novosphingobium sp. CF614]|uniref:DUF1643 domain-containing protein n=1 Tax=Novosphingobium sp. CF614 TaxID=1884364 RepID=UPI0008EA1E2F|nr:DUF1643 domain-containing protein [Novosphingobium sp. CF614]SFG09236.1 hypothetical protein SAMN05518801_10780 [Novosphingobium sp. CF614]
MADHQTYLEKGAIISACGNYRYRLWREWRNHPAPARWNMWTEDDGSPCLDGAGEQLGEPLSCVFVMLNPSTADGEQDDPTIRRCVGFARREGFDRLEVVNLFAWRATSPKNLLMVSPERDPVGYQNQRHVCRALDHAGLIVCAWGVYGGHLDQDETMLGWIDCNNYNDAPVMALGITNRGFPVHPLYQSSDAPLVTYRGRGK